ncbi:MAG: hypothetical protein CMH55_07175 [Myxococcales bacterium]|nr:hypothetical protein [Myxococcales bacterium]
MRRWFGLMLIAMVACASPKPLFESEQSAAPADPEVKASEPGASGTKRVVRIYHTSDEHGWLDGRFSRSKQTRYGGTELLSRFLKSQGFDARRDLLVSGGDMWTGPAISTLLEGRPMVEVFNHLGYVATAVGNHEFDFGLDVLHRNMAASKFSYLAGNVSSVTGERPFEAMKIVERSGLKVAIIGLAYEATPKVTRPDAVAGMNFEDPTAVAVDLAIEARDTRGADFSVIVIHDNVKIFEPHLKALHAAGVRALLGGHVHTPYHETNGSLALCVPKDKLKELCEVEIDLAEDRVRVDRIKITSKDKEIKDPALKAILDQAKVDSDDRGKEVLGQLTGPLPNEGELADHGLGQLVGQAWVAADEKAAVAITNRGGLRMSLPAGPVTVSDIIGVMPFTNSIVRVHLTGPELTEVLKHPQSLATGASLDADGKAQVGGRAIPAGRRVPVLINDFMLFGGDGYRFRKYDAAPVMLDIPWRRPVYAYLRQVGETGPEQLKRAWLKSLKP